MEPLYMNMQPYPHQDGQVHYRPPCYRGVEARSPMSHECWPWGGNYGYASAGPYHGCCNHAYMPPHCAWGSPYSHVPPHPGSYPYFPVQYMPPPPYNVMEHPRYEYGKNMPTEHHCCGCRERPLHQKEQRNVRIEEEEPEKGRGNDSLVPSQFKNSPYPIVWLPPDQKEHGKVKDMKGGRDASRDVKDHENGKPIQQKPAFWNGWLPLDLNNVGKDSSHQDDGKGNFQFPLFWMPYKPGDDTGRENQKKVEGVNARPSSNSEEASDGGEGGQKSDVNRGNTGDRSASRVRDIPVKEVEDRIEKESSVKKASERDTSAKDRTNNSEKKMDNVEGSKRKPPSSPKSSKLPPVCLRVDPLPRRKSANAKSRSPSPPGDKQVKSNEVCTSGNEEKVKDGMKKKTIAVVDGNTSLEKSINVVNVESPGKLQTESHADVSKQQAEEKSVEQVAQKHEEIDAVTNGQSEDTVSAAGENVQLLTAEEVKKDAVETRSKREFSQEEAAVVIQSAYRGFNVRRWEPIKKLKEIARVREQRADVKRLIREMELSSDIQRREKQKNIVAETIMSLLLRLDTIQGLHPSIREVRKSEVRELVNLQEKLDTIMNEKPETSLGRESVIGHDQENVSCKSEDALLSEKINEVYPIELQSKSVGESNPERAEFPEANLIDEAASGQIDMEAAENLVGEGVESSQGPSVKDEDEKSSELLDYDETHVANGDHECSSLQEDSLTRATDLTPTNDLDALETELAELPQAVLDDLSVAEGINYSAVEADSNDQSKQIDEALIGSHIDQESEHEVANKETSDPPLGVLETGETGEGGYFNNCNVDFESGADEEVNSKNEDATSEPNECKVQHQEQFITGSNVPSEASEEVDFTGNISTIDELHENSGITAPKKAATENETSYDAADHSVEVESTAAAESTGDICTVEQSEGVSEMGISSKQVQDHNIEHPPANEAIEKQELEDDQAEHEEDNAVDLSPGGHDMRESNRKLMEENERLRDMMEKLIISGHEQLTAISNLSGRVKGLEKRLRKKKPKVKQQLRAKKSSCESM